MVNPIHITTKPTKKGRPIIRHCRNCEYAKAYYADTIFCSVKFKSKAHYEQRCAGLFCRFFKAKEGEL